MGGGYERGFELGWGEEDTAVEHVAEIFGVALGVGLFGGSVIGDRLIRKKKSGEGTYGIDLGGDFLGADDFAQAGDEGGSEFLDSFVEARFAELIEGGDACAHGERIAGKSSGLINGAKGRNAVHDAGRAGVGCDGQAAAYDFAKGGEVGFDAVERLAGAVAQAKAGNDFVQDKERTVFLGELAETGEKVFLRKDNTHVGGNRLNNDGGDFAFVLRKEVFDGSEIVVGSVQTEFGESLRNARAFGDAERGEAGACLREKAVGVAVIAACKFNDEVAAGEAAGQTDGAHGGFSAAGDETDFIEERDGAADALSELHFELGRYTVAGPLLRLIGNSGDNGGMRVAKQHGSPGTDEVEQAVAVGVEKILAGAALDDERFTADGTESANWAIDAADEDLFGFGEDFAGAAAAVLGRGLRGAHLLCQVSVSKKRNNAAKDRSMYDTQLRFFAPLPRHSE